MIQNSLVIDASVVLEWIESPDSRNHAKAIEIYENLMKGEVVAYAPLFLLVEAVNVLFWKKKYQEIEIREFVDSVIGTGINFVGEFLPESVEELVWVMAKFQITSYDAQYVNLALKKELKLITFDEKLRGIKDVRFEF